MVWEPVSHSSADDEEEDADDAEVTEGDWSRGSGIEDTGSDRGESAGAPAAVVGRGRSCGGGEPMRGAHIAGVFPLRSTRGGARSNHTDDADVKRSVSLGM